MKSIYLFLALLILSSTFAQEKTYTFNKNQLTQVRKFSYSINPLILKPASIKIVRYDTIKTITKEYAVILKENERFKKDSLIAVQNSKPWKRENQFSEVEYYNLNRNPTKYNLKFIEKDTVLVSGYTAIENDYLNLNGTYKVMDAFYQKYGSKNQYLLKENIKNINLELNSFYIMKNLNERSYILMQNIDSKEYILCNNSLLYEYENTKSDDDLKKFNEDYLVWKTKYLELSKSAKNNVAICNSIIKRNTFINALGQSVWNSDKVSKKDKIDFNNNYDLISEKLIKLGDLERERKFYNHYLDNTKDKEGIDVYAISLFQSKAKKFNIE